MKPIEMLQTHCKFNSPYECYVLLAVSRKKDTPEITNSQEIVFREVIKKEEDIIRKYNKMKASITNYKDENGKSYPFYLYVSLNARDAKKATLLLSKQMITWFGEEMNGADCSRHFKKIYGHFYSMLMKKESRGKDKYFMIDFDEKENIDKFLNVLKTYEIPVIFTQETKNGYHIKTKPFDIRLLQDTEWEEDFDMTCPNYELKRDCNIFVEYFKNEMS